MINKKTSLIKRHLTALEAEGDGDSTQKFTYWVNQIISKEDIFMYLVEVWGGVGLIRVEGNHVLLKFRFRRFKIEYRYVGKVNIQWTVPVFSQRRWGTNEGIWIFSAPMASISWSIILISFCRARSPCGMRVNTPSELG